MQSHTDQEKQKVYMQRVQFVTYSAMKVFLTISCVNLTPNHRLTQGIFTGFTNLFLFSFSC